MRHHPSHRLITFTYTPSLSVQAHPLLKIVNVFSIYKAANRTTIHTYCPSRSRAYAIGINTIDTAFNTTSTSSSMSVSTKIDTLSPVTIQSATSIAHLEYDPKKLPSVPSDAWTRFVCISDTHSRTFPVPPGDVLLHSGDLTETGTCEEFKITIEWLYSLPHPIKMSVPCFACAHLLPHITWIV